MPNLIRGRMHKQVLLLLPCQISTGTSWRRFGWREESGPETNSSEHPGNLKTAGGVLFSESHLDGKIYLSFLKVFFRFRFLIFCDADEAFIIEPELQLKKQLQAPHF